MVAITASLKCLHPVLEASPLMDVINPIISDCNERTKSKNCKHESNSHLTSAFNGTKAYSSLAFRRDHFPVQTELNEFLARTVNISVMDSQIAVLKIFRG